MIWLHLAFFLRINVSLAKRVSLAFGEPCFSARSGPPSADALKFALLMPTDPDSLVVMVVEVNPPNSADEVDGNAVVTKKLAVAVTGGDSSAAAATAAPRRALVLGVQWRQLGFFVPDDRVRHTHYMNRVRQPGEEASGIASLPRVLRSCHDKEPPSTTSQWRTRQARPPACFGTRLPDLSAR